MAATDIGDAGASFELGLNPVERRNPLRDQMRGVARPEEALGAAEQAGIVLMPADAPTRPERLRDLRLVAEHASDEVERAGKESRSAEHTSALPSLIRISYAAFCLKKKNH